MPRMHRWRRKVAVITGASSGIGLATARAFVREGLTVIGLARREQIIKVENQEGDGRFHGLKCDVSNEQDVVNVFKRIKKDFGTVQILVNNAGIASTGTLYETSRSDWENMFNTNVMGYLECAKQAVLTMQDSNVEGHIININSVQGLRTYNFGVGINVYGATKYAITAISETLRNDLRDNKIRVTGIYPGYTKTQIFKTAGLDENILHHRPLTPEHIADSIVYVINTPQEVEITDLVIRPLGDNRGALVINDK